MALFLVGLVACQSDKEQSAQADVSARMMALYSSGLNTDRPLAEDVNGVTLMRTVENFYLSSRALRSKSKADYDRFINQYLLGKSVLNLTELKKEHNAVELLLYPSNFMKTIDVFSTTTEELGDKPEGKQIKALTDILSDYERSGFEDHTLLLKYLKMVPEEQFVEEDLYRLPLIAFTFAEVEIRENKLKQAAVSKYVEREKLRASRTKNEDP